MGSWIGNLLVLTISQTFLFAANATLITVVGLVGRSLSTDKSLATLPVTAWVFGMALVTFPASMLMKRIGRRAGFMLGALLGLIGIIVGAVAIDAGNFWLLCFGMMLFGFCGGVGLFYRFAVIEVAPDKYKDIAISLVMVGGLVGGFLGPYVSSHVVGSHGDVNYFSIYVGIAVCLVLMLLILGILRMPKIVASTQQTHPRPMTVIAAQPTFIVAVIGAALGFGVMNFLMVSTPLAMEGHSHGFGSVTHVISWHVIAMFAPSLVTGFLISRLGALNLMFAGVLAFVGSIAAGLTDITVDYFWLSLVMLGIGWNFLFIGGTTLLTETYRPAERAKTQGVNDMIVTATQLFTSVGSGWILARGGWTLVNYFAIPMVIVTGVAILWLMLKRRVAPA